MKNYVDHYEQLAYLMKELSGEIPEVMEGFSNMNKASLKEGVLEHKTKELIALGIAITVRCDGCIAFHVHDAILSGANRKEVMETIGVAVLMGGGPSVMYGCEAIAALEQFENESQLV